MTLKVYNPFNQEVVAELPYDTDSRIGDKIDARPPQRRKMAPGAS